MYLENNDVNDKKDKETKKTDSSNALDFESKKHSCEKCVNRAVDGDNNFIFPTRNFQSLQLSRGKWHLGLLFAFLCNFSRNSIGSGTTDNIEGDFSYSTDFESCNSSLY